MLLHRLARVSQEVAATSARSRKTALLAELFRDAEAEDVPIVIPYLAGRLPQGRIGVGWKVRGRPVDPAAEPAGFRTLLARAGGVRDLKSLTAKLVRLRAAAKRDYEKLVV